MIKPSFLYTSVVMSVMYRDRKGRRGVGHFSTTFTDTQRTRGTEKGHWTPYWGNEKG